MQPWQVGLGVLYVLCFVCRTYHFYDNAMQYGVKQGYRVTMFGNDGYLRLWHLIRIVFDVPMAITGLFLPFIKKTFTLKIMKLKDM